MFNFLKGKKTYAVALGMVVYAILGLNLGQLDANQAVQIIFTGLGFAGLRAGIPQ